MKHSFYMLLVALLSLSLIGCGESGETRAQREAKEKAQSRASRLESDLSSTRSRCREDSETKQKYTDKCVAALKAAPSIMQSVSDAIAKAKAELEEDVAEYEDAMDQGDDYPGFPKHKAFKGLFPTSFTREFDASSTGDAVWAVDESDCSLTYGQAEVEDRQVEFQPSIPRILAFAVQQFETVAIVHFRTESEQEELVAQLGYLGYFEDSPTQQRLFLVGDFLEGLGYVDTEDEESDGGYVKRAIVRAAAPLASDGAVVDLLGTWFIALVEKHDLLKGKSGRLAKQWLEDFWQASWADFRKLDKYLKKNEYLFSSECSYMVGQEAEEEGEGEKLQAMCEKTDKLEGWFYRRWKAAGGGKKGDRIIEVYQDYMIELADVLGMRKHVREWEEQIKTGEGPPWPKPEPEEDDEEEDGE